MIVITCWREASSGTTPPYFRCKGICEATTFETMCLPSRTIATEVSSQEVSIARMFIGQLYAHAQVSRQGTMDDGRWTMDDGRLARGDNIRANSIYRGWTWRECHFTRKSATIRASPVANHATTPTCGSRTLL